MGVYPSGSVAGVYVFVHACDTMMQTKYNFKGGGWVMPWGREKPVLEDINKEVYLVVFVAPNASALCQDIIKNTAK